MPMKKFMEEKGLEAILLVVTFIVGLVIEFIFANSLGFMVSLLSFLALVLIVIGNLDGRDQLPK
mgnify:CR=1 FL=1